MRKTPKVITYRIEGSSLKKRDSGTSRLALISIKDRIREIVVIVDKVIHCTDPTSVSPPLRVMGRQGCDLRFGKMIDHHRRSWLFDPSHLNPNTRTRVDHRIPKERRDDRSNRSDRDQTRVRVDRCQESMAREALLTDLALSDYHLACCWTHPDLPSESTIRTTTILAYPSFIISISP